MVELHAVALPVGSVGAADIRTLVPIQPEPFQIGDELGLMPLFAAFDVGIFDAQDVRAALLPGNEPVIERGTGVTDVQLAGWRRREAHSDRLLMLCWRTHI